MHRLFVAIDLPDEIKRVLQTWQPASGRGIRCTTPDQMHLTLHFLGESELPSTIDALGNVVAEPFSLRMTGVGKFGASSRSVILWAGVESNPALMKLHSAIAEALLPTGYQPEPRPFHPHITLARCQPRTPRPEIESFLHQTVESLAPFVVTEFALYSSQITSAGSVYVRERTYPLSNGSGGSC